MQKAYLNEVDAKIIRDLLADGRKTFTAIADECDQSKSVISQRFKQLQRETVIIGSTIQMDYAALGYNSVGSIYFKIKAQYIDNSVERLSKFPNIYFVLKEENNTAVNIVATLRTIVEFNQLKEFVLRLPTITELRTNIWLGIRNMPYNLKLTDTWVPNETAVRKATGQIIDVSDLETQIINRLSDNGRVSFQSLAKELNVATNTIIEKYRRLKDRNIINTSIQINPQRLGYQAVATFNLAFNSESSISAIVNYVSSLPDIYLIIKTSGQYDLSVHCLIRDVNQFLEAQDAIAGITEVSKSQSFLRRASTVFPSPRQYISTF